MVESGGKFFYLRGKGIPDTSTPQEKLIRMLFAQHPTEEISTQEAEFPSSQLKDFLSNKEYPLDSQR